MIYRFNAKFNIPEFFLYTISFAIAVGWILSQPVTFNSDSTTFLHYANWITGHAEISPFWYLRNPGFPLLLVLSGVTRFQNFYGFMLLQAGFSLGIIYCIYNIVKLNQPKYALLITWLSIATCVPFIFLSLVTAEHSNIFFCLWLIYALIALTNTKQQKYLYYAAFANVGLLLLKPSNYYVFVCSIGYIALCTQLRMSNVVKFLAIYGSAMLLFIGGYGLLKLSHPGLEGLSSLFQGARAISYQVYRDQKFDANYGAANNKLIQAVQQSYPENTLEIFSNPNGANYNLMTNALAAKYGSDEGCKILISATLESYRQEPITFVRWIKSIFSSASNNYTGQMLFYPLMLKAPFIMADESGLRSSKIAATNGPATAEMLQHLQHYIIKREHIWSTWTPTESFANFAGKPNELLNNIFNNPTHVYHAFIWQALDREIGPAATSKLFLNAALEGYATHPLAIMCFLDDLVAYFFGLDVTYKSGNRVMFMPSPGLGEKAHSAQLSTAMLDQMHNAVFNMQSFWDNLYQFYGYVWLLAKVFIFVLALIGAFMTINTRLLPGFLLILALIVYNALITSVFADPFFRYSALTWLLTAIVALQTICYLIEKRALVFSSKSVGQNIALHRT